MPAIRCGWTVWDEVHYNTEGPSLGAATMGGKKKQCFQQQTMYFFRNTSNIAFIKNVM
jgi:hypothetical protein